VFLQVAAELGIAGLAVFLFLLWRAFLAVYQTRRLLRRGAPRAARPGVRQARKGSAPDISPQDAMMLDAHSAAMAASLAGWLVCAFFGSIAYNWTFYYLLALAATPRDILRAAIPSSASLRHARAGAPVAAPGARRPARSPVPRGVDAI
jgi:O-antigen ligase